MKRLLRKVLRIFGYDIVRFSKFKYLLQQEFDTSEDFFFVQIGAFDGVRFDDLYKFVTTTNCKGLVVEPVKDYYDRLVMNYQDYPNVIPVNVGIHRDKKTTKIYRIDPQWSTHVPDWALSTASLNPQHHVGGNIPTEYIIPETITCVTLTELFAKYHVTSVNLLQIDAEGYDLEVLKLINFEEIKPNLIKYEYASLSTVDQKQAVDLLTKNGYSVFKEGHDNVAFLKRFSH